MTDGIELDREDFIKAYDNGEYEYFEFDKRIFEENDSDNDPYELDVTFTLVADPDFEGDVVLSSVAMRWMKIRKLLSQNL